ncbi:amino acid adenylation domain-containing protein [Nocardia sp. NPDC049707]|uniref:amino acid adenylation domain-containing protein n=1 Tax=Nocardia sp. NPDC049707 TaxID=3154735 RepID=UPI003427702D
MTEITVEHEPHLAAAFAASVARNGDRIAVQCGQDALTYTELAALAEGVAFGLTAARHSPGTQTVAVLLDRSVQFVATLIGAVSAGMAYVPIDPADPDEYIQDILDQVRPAVVVTTDDRLTRHPHGTAQWTTVAQLTAAGAGPGASAQPCPDDPAYVIFTSGSTGKPKGVVVGHHSMLNSTEARLRAYGVPVRIPLLHSPAFDVASGVVFYALLGGGTLVVARTPLHDVAATVDLVRDEHITHLVYAASLYAPFLERISADPPTMLTAVMIGSERWSEVLIDRHQRLLPHTSLYNEYGPTEACVWSSYALVYSGTTGQRFALTIGDPILNTRYALLDDSGTEVDTVPGVEGELAIIGVNVAIGYLGRSDLTAQRFVRLGDGTRAYRTGDLVEITGNGQFAILGRTDRQIKIHGNRVEPSHVETTLMTHPRVEQAYVTVRTDLEREAMLVGYLVPVRDSTDAVTSQNAQAHLAARLPHYMVPTAWVVLSTLPRTRNGKIDEHQLPRPTVTVTDSVPPTDAIQSILLDALAEITGTDAITVCAALREVGLGSLSYVQLSAAISRRFDIEIPMSVLFDAYDVRELAEHVRSSAPTNRPALVVAGRDSDQAPLSAQQRQIWILHHLSPSARAYTTQWTLTLTGELHVDALQRALSHIVERHEILRTSFHDGPQGPFQQIHAPWSVRINQIDLSDMDPQAQPIAVERHKRAVLSTGFDIGTLPLVRWQLYRLSETSWQLFQVEHHFVHDGWSATLFLAEIRDAYDAELRSQSNPRPALSVQYRDYARWCDRWRDSDHYRRQRQYWTTALAGCPSTGVTFEPDRPRPPLQTFNGGCVRASIAPEVIATVDAVCAQHGVTRFAVFLSAFALLVWRHTGESDMVIGSALSNRRQVGTADLLGMFVNALPLRLSVEESATPGDIVHGVMGVLLGAQDNQEYPLVDLIEQLDLPRDPARNALFQLMFAFHDSPRPRLELENLRCELWIDHNGSAKNDINVVCVPEPSSDVLSGNRINILWEYNSDLFDHATVLDHAEQFAHILGALVDHWDTALTEFDLLGPQLTERIITAGTGPRSVPAFATIVEGIDHSIKRAPDAVAVIHGSDTTTYRALDEIVARIEGLLAQAGVGAGASVAVACGKSAELIASWVAVLRRGAAYLTLDASQPPAWLANLLRDSESAAVLCSADQADLFCDCEVPVLYVDKAALYSQAAARPPIRPGAPAYLTYTSGSTGTPKAVVTTHANAVAAMHARTVEFGSTPPRTLVTLPVIFDVAGSMIAWTLSLGGTVVLPVDTTAEQDPDAVRALIDTHSITHLNFVASFYPLLLETIDRPWQSSLRVVAIGGEPCTSELVRRHAQLLPQVALHNEYGPTEATVWCSVARVHPREHPDDPARISVGRPIANSSMYVLNTRGQLAPTGARGELVIAGAGISLGYLGRPDLTSQRFGPIATGPLAGTRIYRSGDAARLRADGEFEILGRLDDQVKVRGFRIETGEVSRCLATHPAVRSAFVAVEDVAGTPQLAAFVAAPGHDHTLSAALRRWLGDRLPSYMVPSAYAIVEDLPRTPTGKLDRLHMPAPAGPLAVTGSTEQTSPAQNVLLELWRGVLGRRDITVDDDFFAVGGDSLLAIRTVSLARSQGLELSVPTILRARTIRAMTQQFHEPTSMTRQRRPGGTRLALSAIQCWFFARQFHDPDHFHQIRIFQVSPHAHEHDLMAAIAWSVARHDAFRTVFSQTGGHWQAHLLDNAREPAVSLITLLESAPETSMRAHLDSVCSQLSIREQRLWHIALCTDPGSGRRWLCLVMHHLIIDTVSWDVLTRDIETGHRKLSAGEQLDTHNAAPAAGMPSRIPLQPNAAEFVHWEALLNASTGGIATTTERAPFAALHHTERTLSPLARRFLVRELPLLRKPGERPVLLAAFARGMMLAFGQPLYVLLEGHGRDHLPEADQIIGWLTALYPALLPVGDQPDLLTAAADVERRLGEIPANGINYGIARYLEPTSPLGVLVAKIQAPSITFNYLGQQSSPLATDVLAPVPVETGSGIGPTNVLPTPFGITVVDTGDVMHVRCAHDPARVDSPSAAVVLDAMIAAIEQAARTVHLGGDQDRPNHFLVPPVGGTISWAHALACQPDSPWRWVGLPQSDPGPDTTVAVLAEEYCARIRRIQPVGPYTITGWSFGAAVAFEMTRQLEDTGERIELTMIDPPMIEDQSTAAAALASQLARLMPWATVSVAESAITATAHLVAAERVSALVRCLASMDLGAEELALLERQVTMLLTNHRALAQWHPVGEVAAIDLVVSKATHVAGLVEFELWCRHTRSSVRMEVVEGDHLSMMSGQGLDALRAILYRRVG